MHCDGALNLGLVEGIASFGWKEKFKDGKDSANNFVSQVVSNCILPKVAFLHIVSFGDDTVVEHYFSDVLVNFIEIQLNIVRSCFCLKAAVSFSFYLTQADLHFSTSALLVYGQNFYNF